MTDRPQVAVLGTGKMGAAMARCMAESGLAVRVWNRTPERASPLADVATVHEDAASAVDGADVVVTMLFDTLSVEGVMDQVGRALSPTTVWLQTSTVGVDGAARLAALAAGLGVGYVDAPVLGTLKPAQDGALVVLASGDPDLRPRVEPVLEAIGSRTLWVGESGAGSRLKLACNAWVATVVQGVADSLALTRALGVDPALFLEAVRGGALDAPYVQLKGSAMLDGDFTPSFQLDGVLKDLELMLDAADGAGFEAALLPALRDRFAAGVAQGLGEQDMSAIIRVTDGP